MSGSAKHRKCVLLASVRVTGLDRPGAEFNLAETTGIPAGVQLMKAFIRNDWELHYISIDDTYEADEDVETQGMWLHRRKVLPTRPSKIRRLLTCSRIRIARTVMSRIVRLARQYRPDLIYSLMTSYQVECFLVARLFGLPVVVRQLGSNLGPMVHRRRTLRETWWCRQEYLAYNLPHDLLVITNDGCHGDRVAKYFRPPPSRFVFWRNGVDIPDPVSREDQMKIRGELGLGPDTPMLLSTCRLYWWKHVDRIVQAMPDVLKQFPDAKLVVAGDGEERPALDRLAAELGVTDSILFLGAIPRRRLPALIAACDLYLSTYDMSNVGNALLEAVAMGACIVTLDLGGTAEVIIDGRTGALLDMKDLPSLGRRCAELLADPAQRKRLGDGALRFAKENFRSWEERTDRELDLIEELPRFRRRFRET